MEKYKKYFQSEFFLIFELGLSGVPGSPKYIYFHRYLVRLIILAFLTKLNRIEFLVSFLVLVFHFSVTSCVVWFWISSLHKSLLLILGFLKIPFSVLHLLYINGLLIESFETLCIGIRKDLLILMLKKFSLFYLTVPKAPPLSM